MNCDTSLNVIFCVFHFDPKNKTDPHCHLSSCLIEACILFSKDKLSGFLGICLIWAVRFETPLKNFETSIVTS